MRSILLGFLMLVMLTPSLACAAIMCAAMDRQAQTGQDMPCHGDESRKASERTDNSLTFFKDCSGVDLAQTAHKTVVTKPDLQIDKLFFAWADITPEYHFAPIDAYQIRGPPFDGRSPHFNNHALYLTTQRLRI